MRQAITRRVLLPTMVLFWASGICFAQDQEAEIKTAIDVYHKAIEARDLSQMEPLWVHDGNVLLVNPADKTISVGWEAVKKSWEATFDAIADLKLPRIDGPHIGIKGDTAWSVGIVTSDVKYKSGDMRSAPTLETDVFEKSGGKWLLVSHVASRLPK